MFKEDGTIMHFKQPKVELFFVQSLFRRLAPTAHMACQPHTWTWQIQFPNCKLHAVNICSASCIPVQHLRCERHCRGQV